MSAGASLIGKTSAVDSQESLASYFHAPRDSTNVDRVAASACGLPAYRAVAPHEGNRLRRFDRELDLAAMARTFQMHFTLLCFQSQADGEPFDASTFELTGRWLRRHRVLDANASLMRSQSRLPAPCAEQTSRNRPRPPRFAAREL